MGEERLFSFANRWFSTSVGLVDRDLPGFHPARFRAASLRGATEPAGRPLADDLQRRRLSRTDLPEAEAIAPDSPSRRSATRCTRFAIRRRPRSVAVRHSRSNAPSVTDRPASAGPNSPNLAGQYAATIYKQLHDFKTGARYNSTMSPFALNMTDQDMRDLAAYYAYLPRLPEKRPAGSAPVPAIVLSGSPMRGIAPCGSCHGDIENKLGSPWLGGQSAVYIKAQLAGVRFRKPTTTTPANRCAISPAR